MAWRHLREKFAAHALAQSNLLRQSALFAAVFGLLNAPLVPAQSPSTANTPLPPFEVASVRPNHSGASDAAVYFQAGRFTAKNATAKALIAYAYHVKDFQISGGPSWMDSDRYDIDAKEEDAAADKMKTLSWLQYREQVDQLVQSLLADRFQLRVIHQAKQSSVYALVVARNGPKLTRSPLETPLSDIKGHRGHMIAKAMSLAQLADFLSWLPEVGVRKVLDQTGVSGNFDFTLDWTPDPGPGENAPPPNAIGPSIFTAIQEQLGLKLESTKGPVEVLLIDHIERPSEN